MKKLMIFGAAFLLTACGQVSLDFDIEETPMMVNNSETRLTLIPEGCMTWFDGCNECMVQDQKIFGCTKKACASQGEPKCQVLVDVSAEVPWETLEVTVGPEQVDCVGVAPMRCLVVDGEYFYDKIADFEYERGFSYQLKIEKYQKFTPENVPADASLYSYQLIEILEKVKAN